MQAPSMARALAPVSSPRSGSMGSFVEDVTIRLTSLAPIECLPSRIRRRLQSFRQVSHDQLPAIGTPEPQSRFSARRLVGFYLCGAWESKSCNGAARWNDEDRRKFSAKFVVLYSNRRPSPGLFTSARIWKINSANFANRHHSFASRESIHFHDSSLALSQASISDFSSAGKSPGSIRISTWLPSGNGWFDCGTTTPLRTMPGIPTC